MNNFSATLLKWYKIHKRDLPWRRTREPYHIWICEIIMQQTRISQGLEYYLRFIERFPSLGALAEATEDEVLKYWQGLGYYSRARNLHAAAKSMNGVFPSSYEEVRSLKGVGDYTAAAICSIAYNMPYAVVDGNVYRVLARVFGIATPIDSPSGKKEFTALAQKLLDEKRAGDFNEAIMDFGATCCTPQTPLCANCPFNKNCVAHLEGKEEILPVKAQKIKVTERFFHYIYVEQGKYTWLHKRGAGDVWQNLYEPPLLETKDSFSKWKNSSAYKKLFSTYKPELLATPIKHVLSHRVIHADLYQVTLPPTVKVPEGVLRVEKKHLPDYAISRLVQKLLENGGIL